MTQKVLETAYFDELPEEEQKKFFEQIKKWVEESVVEIYIPEYISNKLEQGLRDIGFSDVEILYSGFWSQGDGASFTGKIDSKYLKKILGVNYELIPDDITIRVERVTNSYVHERTTSCSANTEEVWAYAKEDLGGDDKLADKAENELWELIDKADEWLVKKNMEIYGKIEEFYEGSTSDEAVKSYIEDYGPQFELVQEEKWVIV